MQSELVLIVVFVPFKCSGRVKLFEYFCFSAEFPTTRAEMEAVADKFDRKGDGLIDYRQFVNSLRPDRSAKVGLCSQNNY